MEITLIDKMGTDLTVVNAARVSFSKESEWEYDELKPFDSGPECNLSKKDQKLIEYLARHNHFTPFTHVQITMRERVPIFIARQRFKHTVGFSYNEISRRYVDDEPSFFVPDVWRRRSENKKQGSSDEVITELVFKNPVTGQPIEQAYEDLISFCKETYETMIESGVAPEQARMVLPQSMYTEYYVTGSLSAWARAYKLRIDSHAQREIQQLAEQWDTVISGIKDLEHSWKALTE